MQTRIRAATLAFLMLLLGAEAGALGDLPGEGPSLRQSGVTITQDRIATGQLSLREIRRQGRLVFSTPFNREGGYGDGPIDPGDTVSPGGRPTLQDNGLLLRVNGLDGQSCLECHSIVSHRTVPAVFGVGGVGGAVSNAIFQPTVIDVSDSARAGFAFFDGRFINPPFLFGSGAIQLLANEMTEELQALKAAAVAEPGAWISLVSKGVDFGSLRWAGGAFDTSRVEGIDDDLVVRPFGRKGEFGTVRGFDLAALQFHFGVQPVEEVGADVDDDGDGVANEIRVGEVSALEIFNTNLEPPRQIPLGRSARRGEKLFHEIGCAECHKPTLRTDSRRLAYRLPEVPTDPRANVYYEVDLSRSPTRFRKIPGGGITVPLFADLKRHDMGPELAESFGSELDSEFTTARLWGVWDTAPYLHDGRATTVLEAILMHAGEAADARDAFAWLAQTDQGRVLAFLRSLRTPRNPAADLD